MVLRGVRVTWRENKGGEVLDGSICIARARHVYACVNQADIRPVWLAS